MRRQEFQRVKELIGSHEARKQQGQGLNLSQSKAQVFSRGCVLSCGQRTDRVGPQTSALQSCPLAFYSPQLQMENVSFPGSHVCLRWTLRAGALQPGDSSLPSSQETEAQSSPCSCPSSRGVRSGPSPSSPVLPHAVDSSGCFCQHPLFWKGLL